jgi:hypothetical protein
MVTDLPIIIISFNRGKYLERVVAGYLEQNIPVRIIIHDNGSDDPETLDILRELERHGHTVVRKYKIKDADDLNSVDETVLATLNGKHLPYAVTDCDIDLSVARNDALQIYIELLAKRRDVDCAGPMLRIADIPQSYPLFGRVMQRHIEQFWHRQPEWISTSVGKVALLTDQIDTTFAVHRAGTPFRRLKPGLRVYQPFEALHLDWYVQDHAHGAYRASSSPSISHWDSAHALLEFKGHPIPQEPYFIVAGEMGSLKVAKRHAMAHPP